MEHVTMNDTAGNTLSLDDLKDAGGEDEHAGHNH